jgi:hypothetical protein
MKERKVGGQALVPASHLPRASPDRGWFDCLHELQEAGKPGTREAPTSASAASWADGAPVLWGLSLYESVRRPVTRTDAPPLQAAGGRARPAQHGECPECAIWGVYGPPQCVQTVRTSRGSPIRPEKVASGDERRWGARIAASHLPRPGFVRPCERSGLPRPSCPAPRRTRRADPLAGCGNPACR